MVRDMSPPDSSRLNSGSRPVVGRADIGTALSYISRHACEGLTPARVVKETQQVSLPRFSRSFLAATGLTLRAAIRQCQLEEVRRLLLRTELTPDFIAGQCGFRGLREATRAFLDAGCEVPHALRPRPDHAAADTRRLTRPMQ